MECGVCGDEMTDEEGVSVEGFRIEVNIPERVDGKPLHPEYQKVLDTFGKTDFPTCLTCWVKSLGHKPVK